MRVLVAYASKYGSTREIAEAIAHEIRNGGYEVDLEEAGRVRDVRPYAAVVLGSAIYTYRWRREAVRMLRRHAAELAHRQVRLFQSGPLKQPVEQQPVPKAVAKLLPRISASEPITFGGRLEIDTARGFLARKMIQNGNGGDFRDWATIQSWARETTVALPAGGEGSR